MSSLLTLPPELRLRIYHFLPQLQPNRYETVTAYSKLTPSICRASCTLRRETLPIYASNSIFAVQLDDASLDWTARIATFLAGLGALSISRIRSLQISRHWCIPQPMRWQGHVGFYIQLERRKPKKMPSRSSVASNSTGTFQPEWNARFVTPLMEGIWEVTTGTYPIARDMRGMRLESVKLLTEIVSHRLHVPTPISANAPSTELNPGLLADDVEFLIRAREIVASHPILTYDHEPAESGRRRHHDTWTKMEQELLALNAQSVSRGTGEIDGVLPTQFSAPYY